MSRLRGFLRPADSTRPWQGPYAPYDLVKELVMAVAAVTVLVVICAVLFSSPDDPASTVAQWARQKPADFVTAAVKELDGTSPLAEYGPPYNHNGTGQQAWVLRPQKWLGVSHPIDTANDFVLMPLGTIPNDPQLTSALSSYRAAGEKQQKAWAEAYAAPLEAATKAEEEHKPAPSTVSVDEATGTVTVRTTQAGPVPLMMSSLLALAKTGGLDGSLLASRQFFQTDYTKPLLFMADGGLLSERAEQQHLLGGQWGMMNETGSYPGQTWLWLYTLWYQVEPFKSSVNADILVMLVMGALSLAFICIPFLPIVNRIPRWIPIYRLIWREHYAASRSA